MTKLATKGGKILPQGVGVPICADKRGHPGSSSFGRALGLPELAVEHNFFEIVVIQVCCGAENRIRARLRLGLGKEDRDRQAKERGEPLQIGNGRLVGSGFPTRDRVGCSLYRRRVRAGPGGGAPCSARPNAVSVLSAQ
jgi:hypothetical protein